MVNNPSIESVKSWIGEWVIGLNLCPFASKPFSQEKIRYKVFSGTEVFDLMDLFVEELEHLSGNSNTDTTIIILDQITSDFEDYLDVYYFLEGKLEDFGYQSEFQLASFHPKYCFEGEEPWSNSHYTNRSPIPLVHILRVDQVEAARNFYPDIEEIPNRNIEKMDEMSPEAIKIKFDEFKRKN
jgi:hypothetical protein